MSKTVIFQCYDSPTDTIPALERAYPCCGHYQRPNAFPCTWSCSGVNCVSSGFPTVPTAGVLTILSVCSNTYANSSIPVYFVYDPTLCSDKEGTRVGFQAFGPGMISGSSFCNVTEFHAQAVCEVATGITITIGVHLP